jgi:excisionase family DNA binding protein
MTEIETFLDVRQVAQMLNLSIATIRKWVWTGFIPYKKIGRLVRFSAVEILEWAEKKSVCPELSLRQKGGVK